MKRHNVGDKVIALNNAPNSKSQPRKKGQIYVVEAVLYCCNCGIQTINIGEILDLKRLSNELDCVCGKPQSCHGLHWTDSRLFAKVDDLEKEMQDAIEKEDYEAAAVIRDANIMFDKA